ncbi:MAG TPA: hypothetical protein DCY88_17550 [Cyanobacteria bacterium UBA11372]|nr:hypothetical protein [Cyanobacteria bacterium UBA11372]HBE48575.1 hypothetical protein [Cyanobacteria bacterium UBA11369]
MTNAAFQIKNPSVTLCAFHLCQELTEQPEKLTPDAEKLWEKCANLSEPLAAPELRTLLEKLRSSRTKTFSAGSYVELLPESRSLSYQLPLQLGSSHVELQVSPIQIHDTYILELTLYSQNVTVPVQQLTHLNPQGCLLAKNLDASLGQTLILYGEEPTSLPEQDLDLAHACVDAFLKDSQQKRPVFVEVGKLFGSPIFEYETGQEKPVEQCHILVWLNRHPETKERIEKTHLSFLNLLCCRSKILFAYSQARWCYNQTRRIYAELEQETQSLQHFLKQPVEERLKYLKEKLTKIPLKTFEYARYLRDMEDHKTAIATNAKNYQLWLEKIRQFSFQDDRLEFFDNFFNKTCQRFQEQIQVDLNYLAPARQLFEQMQVAIRGIVEIEQAESDRKREQQQKKLERVVALVGAGLAVSGLSAQSPGKPVETILTQVYPKQSLNCPQDGLAPCLRYSGFYVLFNLGVGVIAALMLGLILDLVSNNSRV